jgi:hypothetical protein
MRDSMMHGAVVRDGVVRCATFVRTFALCRRLENQRGLKADKPGNHNKMEEALH